jgi:hypothetical protein
MCGQRGFESVKDSGWEVAGGGQSKGPNFRGHNGACEIGVMFLVQSTVLWPNHQGLRDWFGTQSSPNDNSNSNQFSLPYSTNVVHNIIQMHGCVPFLCLAFDTGLHYIIFMRRNLENKKKLTSVQITNNANMISVVIFQC